MQAINENENRKTFRKLQIKKVLKLDKILNKTFKQLKKLIIPYLILLFKVCIKQKIYFKN